MNNNTTHESKILTRLIKNPEKNPLEFSEEALRILRRIPENPEKNHLESLEEPLRILRSIH